MFWPKCKQKIETRFENTYFGLSHTFFCLKSRKVEKEEGLNIHFFIVCDFEIKRNAEFVVEH